MSANPAERAPSGLPSVSHRLEKLENDILKKTQTLEDLQNSVNQKIEDVKDLVAHRLTAVVVGQLQVQISLICLEIERTGEKIQNLKTLHEQLTSAINQIVVDSKGLFALVKDKMKEADQALAALEEDRCELEDFMCNTRERAGMAKQELSSTDAEYQRLLKTTANTTELKSELDKLNKLNKDLEKMIKSKKSENDYSTTRKRP